MQNKRNAFDMRNQVRIDDQEVTNAAIQLAMTSYSNHVSSSATNAHSIGNINGLSAALGDKVDDSQVLTNVPENAVFTDTVYTKPASEPISYIDGLQAALDSKEDTISGYTGSVTIVTGVNFTNETTTTQTITITNGIITGVS